MNTYYYIGSPEEIAVVLRDGFRDGFTNDNRRGVYVADSPGEPDPDYPDDQLLEITLPINTAKWRLIDPPRPCRWGEWLIPARILNEHGKLRQLTKTEWLATWEQWKQAWNTDHEQAEEAERKTKYGGKMPDPEIIRANAVAFEHLALNWRHSITGQIANPERADLPTAILFMILDYFDCANSR